MLVNGIIPILKKTKKKHNVVLSSRLSYLHRIDFFLIFDLSVTLFPFLFFKSMLKLYRQYNTLQSGSKYTKEFKKYLVNRENKPISFFHDVPLNFNKLNKTVSMVVEIPRYEVGKFEVCKKTALNPIIQDIKKDNVRFINNIYPFKGYPCNYGSIPQTWEDPTISDHGFKGDNDPIDICDISSLKSNIGEIKNVKILGCIAMIDDGEMDWKILGINSQDPLANSLNSLNDIEQKMPHLLSSLKKWFTVYKKPLGKPENEFTFHGRWLDSDMAAHVIDKCHKRWELLVGGEVKIEKTNELPNIVNSTLTKSAGFTDISNVQCNKLPDTAVPVSTNEIFYY